MHIGMKNGGPFAFAGLWTTWGPKEAPLETCTIITGEPNELAVPIHDRMSVILAPADCDRWLELELGDASTVLRPFAADQMIAYPVSTRVNSPKDDDAKIIEPMTSI
jgi:putative SOS response-associated peptidase YedK